MKVAVLFSGGKDSTLTAFLMNQLSFSITLVTFIPENKYSYMLHSRALEVVDFQAKAMGFPIKKFKVSGEKEKEVEEILKHLSSLNIEGIASGAVSSEYQKQRIDFIANELNVPSYAPLWHKYLLEDYKQMEVIFSSVSSMGLGEEHLGKPVDPFLLKYNFFEGGEAETLVLNAPFFQKKLDIEFEKVFRGTSGEIIIRSVKLVEK